MNRMAALRPTGEAFHDICASIALDVFWRVEWITTIDSFALFLSRLLRQSVTLLVIFSSAESIASDDFFRDRSLSEVLRVATSFLFGARSEFVFFCQRMGILARVQVVVVACFEQGDWSWVVSLVEHDVEASTLYRSDTVSLHAT